MTSPASPPVPADGGHAAVSRPLLRGVSHVVAAPVAAVLGVWLVAAAPAGRGTAAAVCFALVVVAMFAASGLYHRVAWGPRMRGVMRRLDHTAIFLLIGGSYTAYGLVLLQGAWRWAVLGIVWTGVAVAVGLRCIWLGAPGWATVGIAIGLGWVAVLIVPQLVRGVGAGGLALLVGGGALFTLGGIVYARRRPDPVPTVFGFHEVFHVLVVAAVACHYAAIAFFLLPAA